MEHDEEPDGTSYSIRAVQRVCNILDLIQENPDGFSLTQVAEVTRFPKSSAYRYLTTLEDRRYVIRDPLSGLFRIGPAFHPLQARQLAILAERIRPHLVRLHDEFQETINFGVLSGYRVSYVEIIESSHSIRLAARRGDRDPIHCTALGKAIASLLDDDRLTTILEAEGMPRRTPATITSIDRYLDAVAETRTRGYAVDDQENEADGRCVAVPLRDAGIPASISLSGPTSRIDRADIPRYADMLTRAAHHIADDMDRNH